MKVNQINQNKDTCDLQLVRVFRVETLLLCLGAWRRCCEVGGATFDQIQRVKDGETKAIPSHRTVYGLDLSGQLLASHLLLYKLLTHFDRGPINKNICTAIRVKIPH